MVTKKKFQSTSANEICALCFTVREIFRESTEIDIRLINKFSPNVSRLISGLKMKEELGQKLLVCRLADQKRKKIAQGGHGFRSLPDKNPLSRQLHEDLPPYKLQF